MKRFWIGITVLAVLLAAGVAITAYISGSHAPISDQLAQAAQAAENETWTQATDLARQAQAQWLQCRDFTAAFADHTVLEEIDAIFAEIDVYAATGDKISFAAACAHLSELTKAMAESHLPKWQNIL